MPRLCSGTQDEQRLCHRAGPGAGQAVREMKRTQSCGPRDVVLPPGFLKLFVLYPSAYVFVEVLFTYLFTCCVHKYAHV